MHIAVIGMGNVGATLGRRFAAAGHDMMFCVRDPGESGKRAEAPAAKAGIGPVGAAGRADAVLLAVLCRAVRRATLGPCLAARGMHHLRRPAGSTSFSPEFAPAYSTDRC